MNPSQQAENGLPSPVAYFGGKGIQWPWVLEAFPAHQVYCEPFFGGGSLFFRKRPAPSEVINDIDGGVYAFFKTIQDPESFEQFYRRALCVPYSRREYNEARATWREEQDQVIKAVKWFVVARQSFSGCIHGGNWGYAVRSANRGMASVCSRLFGALAGLPAVHSRLMGTQIDQFPAVRVIKNFDSPDTLHYCDPPYIHATRSSGGFACEMTDQDHDELLDTLLAVEGMVVLSGYANDLYDDRLADWGRRSVKTSSWAAARTKATGILGAGAATELQPRTEVLWLNPACTAALEAESAPLFAEAETGGAP